MSEFRTIKVKHKARDAKIIRSAVSGINDRSTANECDLLQVLLYLTDLVRKIDDAFKPCLDRDVGSAD